MEKENENSHVFLHEGLPVKVLVKVHLRIIRRKRVICADCINFVVLLSGNVEVVGGVVRRVLGDIRILDRKIGNAGR